MEFLHLLEKIRMPGLNELMLAVTELGGETPFLVIIWGDTPHWRREQLGQSGCFRRLEREPSGWLAAGKHSETYTGGPCYGPTHLSLRRVSAGEHGDKVLELGVGRMDPERGLLLIVKRQPEGLEMRSCANRSVHGGNLDHHRGETRLLSDVQGAGSLLQPLS